MELFYSEQMERTYFIFNLNQMKVNYNFYFKLIEILYNFLCNKM